jgi:hypothetical protein
LKYSDRPSHNKNIKEYGISLSDPGAFNELVHKTCPAKTDAVEILKEAGMEGNEYIVQKFIFECPKPAVMRKLFITVILSLFLGACLFSQIPTDGLVLYLPFNFDANDHSGNGNNGITHEVYYLRGDRGVTAYFTPRSYVEIKDTGSLDFSNVTGLTIATWIRQEQDISGYIVVKMGTGGRTEYEYKLAVNFDGTINSAIVSPTSIQLLDSNGKLFLNEWYNVVLRWDRSDSTISIYRNGELNSLMYSNITSIQNTSVPLRIGQYIDELENSFRGSLDDLRIYNRPLSEDEIKSLYTSKVVTALDEIPGTKGIDVYPNPVQSALTIVLPGFSGQAAFAICDVSGRIIVKGKLNSNESTIDLNSLRAGFYSIQIQDGNQTVSRKIIKE